MPVEITSTGTRTTVAAGASRDVLAQVAEDGGRVLVQIQVRCGHLAPDTRADLVAAVLELPVVRARRRLRVWLPLGDAELLQQLRQRCSSFEARAAGATSVVDAELDDVD